MPDSRRPRPALLIIDMINAFQFPGAEGLLPKALQAGRRILELRERFRAAGQPVIYVNDNFGAWRSDRSTLLRECGASGARGAPLVRLLAPHEDDYFIIKPRHSGFFATSLRLLLQDLDVNSLVLTGVTTDICIRATAMDAYMHGYPLRVPCDCTATVLARHHEQALEFLREVCKADIRPQYEETEEADRCDGDPD
ncbi:MAG: isochorismatase family cysteine hydrolase [Burkholderiaceae bacterium]